MAPTDGQTPWSEVRPPCRTVVGLSPRAQTARAWDQDNPTYVPDTQPDWTRVVAIG